VQLLLALAVFGLQDQATLRGSETVLISAHSLTAAAL
jgi:hypothetical protein